MKGDRACGALGDEPAIDEIMDALGRSIASPPTVETLTAELLDARRRLKAVESVLLAKIAQEFDGDARRMAREILNLRMSLADAQCLR